MRGLDPSGPSCGGLTWWYCLLVHRCNSRVAGPASGNSNVSRRSPVAVSFSIVARMTLEEQASTLRRQSHVKAITPQRYRSWIIPHDPHSTVEAARVLDLYPGTWERVLLGCDDYAVYEPEKLQLEPLRRVHPGTAGRTGTGLRLEFEIRTGRHTLAYMGG
jgi:hypothetical protein